MDLAGKRVVVTRAAHQADSLVNLLREADAEPLVVPTIMIVEPESWDEADEAIGVLADFDWMAFTSSNAVDAFFTRAERLGVNLPPSVKVAAVGRSTLHRLADRGFDVALTPERSSAVDLALALIRGPGRRILIPRAAEVPADMRNTLTGAGWDVVEVPVYRTVTASVEDDASADLKAGRFDVLTFTSGSSVLGFLALIGEPDKLGVGVDASTGKVTACIGPRTAAAAETAGFRVDVVAEEQTAAGLVSALRAWDD